MDEFFEKQMADNCVNYKRSLDRIIGKYSKLQHHDGAIEVDLENTKTRTLERYMKRSKEELSMLESKSLTELRDESVRAQDTMRDSQLDFSHQSGGADDTCVSSVSSVSTTCMTVEEDGCVSEAGMTRSDTTQLTVSSLDESQRTISEAELQPEDQDEELEMSLRRHGSLVDLYPSMISRIEKAWCRQHVSEAADSVLRRYRRWRQQSNRSLNSNNTFTVNLKHNKSNAERMTSKENYGGPVTRHFMGTESNSRSHLQMMCNQQDWQAQQQSPGRGRGLLRREQHKPILVMDFSGPPETIKTKEISLNETFTVSDLSPPEESQRGERPPSYSVSPSRCSYPTPKGPLDLSLRSKRLSNAAHSLQTDPYSMYTSQTAAVRERPDFNRSPVRQSPAKAWMMSGLSRSPQAFSRSPQPYSEESFSREPMRPRSLSMSLSSPQPKHTLPQRMFYPQEYPQQSFQSQLPSPHSNRAAESRHRFRRHLSFDSSLPSNHVSYSPKKLDEDFKKLYHKFVCQNKSSFFKGLPCRFCARGSEASRGHSSSALAALALSPHRSVLRKRHRELSLDSHPQSKRFREEYCAPSPGSQRRGTAMLRRRLSPSESEQPYDGRSYSPSKHGVFQRSADPYQDVWMSRSRYGSAAEFSGHGSCLERRMVPSK